MSDKLRLVVARGLGVCLLLAGVVGTAVASQDEASAVAGSSPPASLAVEIPQVVLTDIGFTIKASARDTQGDLMRGYVGSILVEGASAPGEWRFSDGQVEIEQVRVTTSGATTIRLRADGVVSEQAVRAIPGIYSVLPPLFAIVLALIFRQVVVSLFSGIWLGAFFLYDYNPVASFLAVLDRFVVEAFVDTSHAQIIIFSMLFGGMVGVITRNGGARGIASLITQFATTARGGQLAAWATALVLFFDDYANALIRGNLLRPITDKLRISREKLSFIVDAGAASVPSVFLVSTWIGYEVGLIDGALRIIDSDANAYSMFVASIPYRFYPFLIMALTFFVAYSGRDFGPMLTAERRARREGKVLADGAQPATEVLDDHTPSGGQALTIWYNGLIPIAAVLAVAFFGIYWTGSKVLAEGGVSEYGLREILSSSDSSVALLWASLTGCVVAMSLATAQKIMTIGDSVDAWLLGLKSMLTAIVILLLAWSIGAVTEQLHTASYVVQILGGVLSPVWLPVLTFIISAAIAFATGTSWATMAIIMPLVIPLADNLSKGIDMPPDDANTILVGVISSVLAGAVFGDHCSPISDTTILSSMSSACDHIDHVRTQLPYALVAAVVGMIVGDIPTAFGLSPWISLLLGVVAMAAIVYIVGRRVDEPPPISAIE